MGDGITHSRPKVKPAEPETPRSVEVIEVIKTVAIRGNGADTLLREVIQYWDLEGKLLAEYDPINEGGNENE